MSAIFEAVDFLKRQAKLHEAFVQAAAQLERIGSVEQAAKEADDQAKAAQAAQAKAQAELDKIKGDIAEAETKAVVIVADAVEAAQKTAQTIVDAAEAKAAEVFKSVHEASLRSAEQAKSEREKASLELDAITSKASVVRDEVGQAQAEFNRLTAESARLTKAIEALKSKFA